MKKLLSIIFALTIVNIASAQQYTTSLYFEDKDGNIDSLIVSLDNDASFSPTDEGETTYTTEQMLSVVNSGGKWAWIRHQYYDKESKSWSILFTQTNIVPPLATNNSLESAKFDIIVPFDRLPITISWNKDFFNTPSLKKSLITDMVSWFDVISEYTSIFPPIIMSLESSAVINPVPEEYWQEEGSLLSLSKNYNTYFKQISMAFAPETYTSVEQINTPKQGKLVFDNGNMFILHNNHIYNILGTKVQ